ncbi:bicyclomycin/multidrug efflux system [Micromonospora sp. MW-13]|nr:bicyclomycin/multidrug efflux system [Micromonospora sp. MW-13]
MARVVQSTGGVTPVPVPRGAGRAATAGGPTDRGTGVGLLVLLGALTAVGPLSLDMYLPAFPAMTDELGPARPRSSSR